nr:ABC transporter B family member 9-like [Ipomoea batatas]
MGHGLKPSDHLVIVQGRRRRRYGRTVGCRGLASGVGLDMVIVLFSSYEVTGAAMANGFAQPFMSMIIFGELINSFAMVDQSHVVHTVSKEMLCWTIIGERQAARMRGLYLKAILRQDIAFFDTEMSTGEVASSLEKKQAIDKYTTTTLKIAYRDIKFYKAWLSGGGAGALLLVVFSTYGLAFWALGQISSYLSAFAAGQVSSKARCANLFWIINAHPKFPNCSSGRSKVGSGKSSVISLLERFYDPDAGEENATDLEIRTALQIANAANFIDELPKGLDTMVGEHGMQLSDEQKQRNKWCKMHSTILYQTEQLWFIAHRLTTIRNADLIAVLQSGKLVEQAMQFGLDYLLMLPLFGCLVGDALALLVQSIATALSGLIIAFHANWALALIIVCVLPLMFADLLVQTWLSSGSSVDPKVMYKEASQIASEAIGGIRTVASFCAEEKVMAVYLKKCEVLVTQGVHAGIINGVGFAFGSLAFYLANAFFFYIGAVLIQHDKAAFSEVLTVFYAMTMLGLGVSQAYAMAPDVSKAKDSAASIFAMLDRRPKIDSSSKQGKTFPIVWGEIEFDHVSFKYPTRPDIQIFKDLNLKIPSGKMGLGAENVNTLQRDMFVTILRMQKQGTVDR